MTNISKIFFYLEDGNSFTGEGFGYIPKKDQLIFSEIVFNTSMYGYQEVFSDPSYCDQSIVMTYPLIGNYGVNSSDNESESPALKAIIVREYCNTPSNFRSETSIDKYLKGHKICGISNIDTRYLTKLIREKGTMKAYISSEEITENLLSTLFKVDLPIDQIIKTSTKQNIFHTGDKEKHIVLIDYGFKNNILRSLLSRDCSVTVVPWNASFEEIEKLKPHGILLTNGPGDPMSIESVLPTIKKLQEKYPLFCICMGHEIFAMANGAKVEKMKFGHRGGNHPVKDFENNRVYITAQNHGHCVSQKSIAGTDLIVTQVNLNDGTIEALKHKTLPAFSVQYHPEASPGPNDTKYLFDDFINLITGVENA